MFLLKPGPFCKLSLALELHQICHFSSFLLFPVFRSVHATHFFSLSFLSHTLWDNCEKISILSSFLLSGYSGYLVTHFLRAMTRPMRWPDKMSCFRSTVPWSLCLLPFVSTHLFFGARCVLSHQKFSTHKFLSYLLKNLCFFISLAESSSAFAEADTGLF